MRNLSAKEKNFWRAFWNTVSIRYLHERNMSKKESKTDNSLFRKINK